jgi:hypothetical protein
MVHPCVRRGLDFLLLVSALDPSLLQQLAVLFLRHALAALLDDRAHETTPSWAFADDGDANTLARYGRLDTQVTRVTAPPRAQPASQVPAGLRRANPAGETPRSGVAFADRNPLPPQEVPTKAALRY